MLNPLMNVKSAKVYLVVSKIRRNSTYSNMKASFLQEQFFGAQTINLYDVMTNISRLITYDIDMIFNFFVGGIHHQRR